LLVSDRDLPAADGVVFERLNPITGNVATRAAAASVADALERRGPDFVATMADETGATEAWGRFNVALAAAMMREAAALTTQIAGEIIPSDRPGVTAFALRQPIGVVLGVAPWNAPVILGVRAIAAPLACGNTVVLKGSEFCPHVHRLIGEACRDAGLGEGVVNVVSNAPADASRIVEALIANRRCGGSTSPARPASGGRSPSWRRVTSSRRGSSSAARRR
jgi:acyl-CoA reductase-like NAD-dependent aldehyde dehydrogenase